MTDASRDRAGATPACPVPAAPVDLYGTHNEALAFAVCRTSGPVVELGCGWYSTPLLHGLCEGLGRELFTIESDETWLALFDEWASFGHHMIFDPEVGIPEGAGVVLIDHESPVVTRAGSIREAREKFVQIVVVHDTWPHADPIAIFVGLQDALDEFTHRRDWKQQGPGEFWPQGRPWTTALSDVVAL